jgi:hypothetical protein
MKRTGGKPVKIMEVIQMGEDVKKTWHEKFLSESDLEKFEEIGKKFTPEMMEAYQARWAALVDEIKHDIGLDPASDRAQDLGKRWAELFNEAYGGHPELTPKIAAAYSSGAIPREYDMIGPEVWGFIKKVHAAAEEAKK